ncbi:MAG: BlaI/MecI/CopY family transcriptional regulator [Phycisphaeraceae bacterium]|nr:MAG: BlaI/MecI/CopY family transcriptional regulator [Phycisphaeraceae bacterium]
MANKPINETEWDVLNALWRGGPATARGITEALSPTRGWAYSTVKTVLDRMAEKGLVHARRVGNVWEYSAKVREGEARRSAWRRFLAGAFGGAVEPALGFIAHEAGLTPKEREKLARLIAEARDDR